jgi:hypothetical protein
MASRGWLLGVLLCSALGCGESSGGAEGAGAGGAAANTAGATGKGAAPAGMAGVNGSGGATSTAGTSSGGGGNEPSTGGSAGSETGGSGNSAGEASAGTSAGGGQSGPVTCRAAGDGKSTVSFVNECDGQLSFRGSDIDGGELAPGEHACRDVGSDVESIPAIRFWGFVGMDPGPEKHTLAELTLNTDFNDFDWYNISHVDAHNLPMQIVAVGMPDCRVLTCAESLLENCPAEGQLTDADGQLISCFSPMRDDPNSAVAQYFEAGCADAYSWSGDDAESVAACAGEDYDVIFCPH